MSSTGNQFTLAVERPHSGTDFDVPTDRSWPNPGITCRIKSEPLQITPVLENLARSCIAGQLRSANEYHARHSEEGLQRRRVRLTFTRSSISHGRSLVPLQLLLSASARSVGVAALLR
jgi:hypothetical protein